MPGKMTKSILRPPLGPPQVPAAVRSSRLSCGKVGKAQKFTSARESSGESRLKSHGPEAIMIRLRSSTALIALHLAAWNPTIAACEPTYTIEDLGTLRGTTSAGTAINAAGSVTGSSWDEPGQNFRAFRYVDGIGMIDL